MRIKKTRLIMISYLFFVIITLRVAETSTNIDSNTQSPPGWDIGIKMPNYDPLINNSIVSINSSLIANSLNGLEIKIGFINLNGETKINLNKIEWFLERDGNESHPFSIHFLLGSINNIELLVYDAECNEKSVNYDVEGENAEDEGYQEPSDEEVENEDEYVCTPDTSDNDPTTNASFDFATLLVVSTIIVLFKSKKLKKQS